VLSSVLLHNSCLTAQEEHEMTQVHSTTSQSSSEQILQTASELFYAHGVRAVGIDLIVLHSGVAKTTLYRHFSTKDDLVEAFLLREDADFWQLWDAVVSPHRDDAMAALLALADWVAMKVSRDGYRGCPQINVAAEFSSLDHPARKVARAHKAQMLKRLTAICRKLPSVAPDSLAMQLSLLIDGAFSSDGRLKKSSAQALLRDAVRKLAR
jgi:AcrR family transcriptional regulator